MKLDKLIRKTVKSLRKERGRLDIEIRRVDSMLTALDGVDRNSPTIRTHKPGPRKGRKMSAAHRRAIKEGIARAKAAKKS